jgi:hypothetical protein
MLLPPSGKNWVRRVYVSVLVVIIITEIVRFLIRLEVILRLAIVFVSLNTCFMRVLCTLNRVPRK